MIFQKSFEKNPSPEHKMMISNDQNIFVNGRTALHFD